MATLTDFREGRLTKTIERRTSGIPSDMFLWAAIASIGVSLATRLMNRKEDSQFIGQWAPTFLILGLYNKLVKIAGSEGERISRH